MISGQLRFIVMHALSSTKMSGYSLMKHIKEHTGCWKPSSGSIYPLLEDMLKNKHVSMEKKGRKKLYTLTKKGKDEFEHMSHKRFEFIDRMLDGIKVYGTFRHEDDGSYVEDLLERIKKEEAPLSELNPELQEIRATLFEMYSGGKIGRNKNEIKDILRKAATSLKNLK
jgi:DNA-binding PadR family transcriptional regulator